MTDSATDQRRGNTAAVWLVVAVALSPIAYALSVGPAIWLFGPIRPPRFIHSIYKPLIWLADHCQPFDDVLRWYVSLWTE